MLPSWRPNPPKGPTFRATNHPSLALRPITSPYGPRRFTWRDGYSATRNGRDWAQVSCTASPLRNSLRMDTGASMNGHFPPQATITRPTPAWHSTGSFPRILLPWRHWAEGWTFTSFSPIRMGRPLRCLTIATAILESKAGANLPFPICLMPARRPGEMMNRPQRVSLGFQISLTGAATRNF